MMTGCYSSTFSREHHTEGLSDSLEEDGKICEGGRENKSLYEKCFVRKVMRWDLLPGPNIQILTHWCTLSYSNKQEQQKQRNTDPSPCRVARAPTYTPQPPFLSPILQGCKWRCFPSQQGALNIRLRKNLGDLLPTTSSHRNKYYSEIWAQLSELPSPPGCKLLFMSQIRHKNLNKERHTPCHQILWDVGILAFPSTTSQDLGISTPVLLTPAITDLPVHVSCFTVGPWSAPMGMLQVLSPAPKLHRHSPQAPGA